MSQLLSSFFLISSGMVLGGFIVNSIWIRHFRKWEKEKTLTWNDNE